MVQLFFVNELIDVKTIHSKSDYKIFSFNGRMHKLLTKNKIEHEVAENYASKIDRLKIFDLTVSCYNWYTQNILFKELEFEGINLLGILDTAEFHTYMISQLKIFLILKRVIENKKPTKILIPENFLPAVKTICDEKNINIETYNEITISALPWDKIQIKFNVNRIPISFHVSRNFYLKMKNMLEMIIGKSFNLWFNPKNKKKIILLLEFNPAVYFDFLYHLGKSDKNIVLFNMRRSAVWNLQSIRTMLRSNCKMLNLQKFIDKDAKKQISSLVEQYDVKLEKLWLNKKLFVPLFSFEGYTLWPFMKDTLFDTYKKRISEYIILIIAAKKMFETTDITCIVGLNVMGETEKTIIEMKKNNTHFIMLEHGFANYTYTLSRFDILGNYQLLRDKIAVWGNIQKDYLVQHHKYDENNIIISGSPRHDSFFKRKVTEMSNKTKVILLTIVPITDTRGQNDTNIYIRFENFIIFFCATIKKFDNVRVIVKLHPAQIEHNEDIKLLFKQIDPTIPVYQTNPLIDLIKSADVVININPESSDSSTAIMEALILEKPTITVFLDGEYNDLKFVKDNATLSMFDETNLEKNLSSILYDQEFRCKLIHNAKNFLKDYLSNQGKASEYLANIIKSY